MSRESRRNFVRQLAALSSVAYVATPRSDCFAANPSDDKLLPNVTNGVASGDVDISRATIWGRCDRPATMFVEYSAHEDFRNAQRIQGPDALAGSDFTAKLDLRNLPAGEELFYRVSFRDLERIERFSAPVTGRLVTASDDAKKDVSFAWSGDTAGQGWGLDASRGGMKTFETMRQLRPDFFVHSGDICYSDGPFSSEVTLDDGSLWKNLVSEGTSKVAETLDEFRANFRYNMLDENVRSFQAEVPVLAQWDDHETTNNWYPGEQLHGDDRYTVKSASLLAARARQAFWEYTPTRSSVRDRIFRKISRGPLLDLFFLDLRSFRGANSPNRQAERGPETAFLGTQQIAWLKRQLRSSNAIWKFICSDMPIGLMVGDGENFEASSNGDGPVLGREHEIAELLRFVKQQDVKNVVFITADVHYAASHHYAPERAQFTDFNPFWEFVSGPLHAGTFGPGKLDDTFGPEVRFNSLPMDMKQNRPPSEGLQFFGLVKLNAADRTAQVQHINRDGEKLWETRLEPK